MTPTFRAICKGGNSPDPLDYANLVVRDLPMVREHAGAPWTMPDEIVTTEYPSGRVTGRYLRQGSSVVFRWEPE
jgi:hypothetical protein